MTGTRKTDFENVPTDLCLREIVELGQDTRRGNLLGIQPFMVPTDYVSPSTFQAKIDGYLDAARRQGWLNEKTIVVLPEYLGSWLVMVDERLEVYWAATVASALRILASSRPLALFAAMLRARARDHIKAGLFYTKAPQMAQAYHGTFRKLAARYKVSIVAGSIVLPSPQVSDGQLRSGKGKLYNLSVVYRPDGVPHQQVTRKAYPIDSELFFLNAGSPVDPPVYDTPAGKLGVLICTDAWYPQSYQALRAQGAELIAVPSYLSPDSVWETPWRGYNGAPAPDDVAPGDVGRITEGEAWLKYGPAGRISRAGIAHGINVFLRGDLWDLGSDGHTVVVREGATVQAKHIVGAALVNSWL